MRILHSGTKKFRVGTPRAISQFLRQRGGLFTGMAQFATKLRSTQNLPAHDGGSSRLNARRRVSLNEPNALKQNEHVNRFAPRLEARAQAARPDFVHYSRGAIQ